VQLALFPMSVTGIEALKRFPPTIWWKCGDGTWSGLTRGSTLSSDSWEQPNRNIVWASTSAARARVDRRPIILCEQYSQWWHNLLFVRSVQSAVIEAGHLSLYTYRIKTAPDSTHKAVHNYRVIPYYRGTMLSIVNIARLIRAYELQ